MNTSQASQLAFVKLSEAIEALMLLGLAVLLAGARGAVKGLEAIEQSSKWAVPGRAE